MKSLTKLCFTAALLYAGTLWGQSTYQGQLNDGGQPYNGTVDLAFQLYDQETGGNTVGAEQEVDGVAVTGGLFQADFFLPSTAYGDERWLEVTVDGEVLSPRQKVTAAPWAKQADRAVEASEAQNFRIGFSNVTGSGSLGMGAFSNAGGTASFAGGTGAIANNDNSFVWSGNPGTGGGTFETTGDNQFLIRAPGGVGVNTDNPLAAFHVVADGTRAARFTRDDMDVYIGVSTSEGAALRGVKSGAGGRGVHGSCLNSSGTCRALYANSNSADGYGIYSVGTAGSRNYFQRTVLTDEDVVIVDGDLYYQHQPQAQSGDEACWIFNGDNTYRLRRCGGSSARLKKKVEDLDIGFDLVRRMRPVGFVWKESGRADIGLIAEEVAELDPRLAKFDEDGRPDGVDYRHLSALLIKALQERETVVDNEFARLDEEVRIRDAEIAELRAGLAEVRALAAGAAGATDRLAALEAILLDGAEAAVAE